MAHDGSNRDNAPTTCDHHAPMLLNHYRGSPPPLAGHILDKPAEQRAQWLGQDLSSTSRAKSDHGALPMYNWASVRRTCKEWLKNPMNIALIFWFICVGASGGMLVLLLLGLLDGAFPAPADRNRWIEINNQLLNALFTLMSVYQHPVLCHHLFLLCRWRTQDAAELRAAYCKQEGNARPRSGERAHMAVVVALLQLTVASQYVLCGLYWGYTKNTRPELVEDGFFVLGVVAPVAAAAYTVYSPLGRVEQPELLPSSDSMAKRAHQKAIVVEPEWAGGMFDCGGEPTTWCLSLSCTFCVFGWNMERLGLGNRYVHATTFALLCFAPLWVLGVSALHIHDYVVGDAVGGAGVLLCACGLLYGGYWRIQMRRRFVLPGTASACCCGSTSLTDYARWLFCWPCALAQEVRTANLYDVDGETLYYAKVVVDDDHDERQPLLLSNHHDVSCPGDMVVVLSSSGKSSAPVVVHDEAAMVPPAPVVVLQVEDDDDDKSEKHPDVVISQEEDESLSEGSWRAEKVKKLINVVTLMSLLILLYTRGFVR